MACKLEVSAPLSAPPLLPPKTCRVSAMLTRVCLSAGPETPESSGSAAHAAGQIINSQSDEQPENSSQVPESPEVAESPAFQRATAERWHAPAQPLFGDSDPEGTAGTAAVQQAPGRIKETHPKPVAVPPHRAELTPSAQMPAGNAPDLNCQKHKVNVGVYHAMPFMP